MGAFGDKINGNNLSNLDPWLFYNVTIINKSGIFLFVFEYSIPLIDKKYWKYVRHQHFSGTRRTWMLGETAASWCPCYSGSLNWSGC